MRLFINILFTSSLIILCTIIVSVFSDNFVDALSSESTPRDKSLQIKSCQEWTKKVRDFNVSKGDGAKKVTVLMYHRVIDDADIGDELLNDKDLLKSTIIRKSQFEKQMNWLKEKNYETLTGREFQLFMQGKIAVPEKSVLLTFDDGFQDNFTEVYPILKKYNFRALNFIITGLLAPKTQIYDPAAFQYLSASEIRESCDVFEFQSHSNNFHKKNEKGTAFLIAKQKKEIIDDVHKSLVHLDNLNLSFAYPYGEYDEETIDAIKQLGIEMAFTIEYKDAKPGMNMYKIPRKGVYPEDTLEDFKWKINSDEG
ncbi:polysaccharide deacetylase family protein [Virgibacillus oceani]|uniref:Xylanase n=1 Tax=Virgibacillus oceani TaxID=1479511 RepID=A0A917H9V0_9BACI|nr:polysaccharide deacetylase family protein [Virgibacillus oceani]GGG72244.1 xylanase [Virgibacillus oceani]